MTQADEVYLEGFVGEAGAAGSRVDAGFEALVLRQSGFLYRVAYSLLRNPQDAEDAVQETLLKLFRSGAWQGMEDEKAFLARAVWRVGLNRLAGNGGKAMRQAADVTEMELAVGGESPEDAAVGRSDKALLRRLIDGLGEEMRTTLLLSAMEGMTSAQVAVTLGIPEGTVRTRLMRAREELKRRFAATRKEVRR